MAAAQSDFEAVVGLEVHCRLKTASKAFCACSARFGAPPNSNTCPSCLGLPGALPVFNERALELGLSLALALGCEVPEQSRFARKHYFYADLPKGYQISQFDRPLAWGGQLEVELEDGAAGRFRLTRVHLEEDAGKSLHEADAGATWIDFNRAGTPLVEIVSEPDLRTAAEARAYLGELRRLVRWLGVSDGNMDEGSLRCDCNVSLRPLGRAELGTRVELKNLNSIRAVGRAIEHETDRQAGILRAGGAVEFGTRHWDDGAGKSRAMRGKESAPDYRYLVDPDLPPLVVSQRLRESRLAALPELPAAMERRFVAELALPPGDAAVLTSSRRLAEFFERLVEATAQPREAAHWVLGEFLRESSEGAIDLEDEAAEPPVSVGQLASLMELVELGAVSKSAAKTVFAAMAGTSEQPSAVLDRLGLQQLRAEDELLEVVRAVLAENPRAVADHRAGRQKSLGFLVGRAMAATQGRADPGLVNELLRRELERA